MFCRRCGRQIDDNSKFCVFCGTSLSEEKPADPFADLGEDGKQEENTANDRQKFTHEPTFRTAPYNYPVNERNENKPVDDKKLNAFSISGMIIGIIGLLLCVGGLTDVNGGGLVYGLFVVTGLVLSVVGLMKSKEYNSGKIIGIVGIVIGAIAVILWIVLLVLVIITPYIASGL